MHCGVFTRSQQPKCPADPTERSWAISPQIREKTCPKLCDCPWMPVTQLKYPYCQGGPLGTGIWSWFILWKHWVYHFSPIRGIFNLSVWDTNKMKASYSPLWGRRKPGFLTLTDTERGETGFPVTLSSKKPAWGPKITHRWDLPGSRRPHLKEGGDSGAMVAVQAPKLDLPPQTVFWAGQSPLKQLLQKAEQVGNPSGNKDKALKLYLPWQALKYSPCFVLFSFVLFFGGFGFFWVC